MASSKGRGRRPVPADSTAPRLMDLPGHILEVILSMLSLKLRMRFSTTCRAAHQLVGSSPVLFRRVTATCYSRKQTLALFRWLAGGCRGVQVARLYCTSQELSMERQLGQAISMQGACLEKLDLWMRDVPVQLAGAWLSCLTRLRELSIAASSAVLDSACGQLTALQELTVRCGREIPCANLSKWRVEYWSPSTVSVQPGAIPPGLTRASFNCCSFPQLPDALCAASSLQDLQLNLCVESVSEECRAPQLEPAFTRLTALTELHLVRLVLEQQDVAHQLWRLTNLQALNLTDCCLQRGEQQALCSGLTCLSCLASLSIAGGAWAGSMKAEPGSLPHLRQLCAVLPPGHSDQRVPIVSAAPGLGVLIVSASSLLGGGLLEQLQQLPQLTDLVIILPPGKEMRDQVATGGAQRLVDGLTSLPALEYVILVFADQGMLEDPCFASIRDGLGQAAMEIDCALFEDVTPIVW